MFRPLSRALQAVTAVIAVMGSASPHAPGAAEVDEALLNFVVGDDAIVGREPDGGATYGGLVLRRRRDGHEITATGGWDVPSPPGEGRVLRFRWRDPAPTLMTCLVGSDLDNHARLTCLRAREDARPTVPGLDAMFPTAA